nr:cytochrome c biogenesis FN [Cuscuta chapalana]
MSIYEFFHYSFFPGLFVAFTYNKKQPPVFGAAPAFFCILLSFLGLSFRHIPNNLSNYNVLTANSPFFYQISGTWSNHEGSILSWCRILSFYGFLLCYRGRPNVSKRGGHRETFFYSFVSNFVNNSILSLPRYEQQSGAPLVSHSYTKPLRRTLVDSELRSRRNRTFDGPALFYDPERKMSFAPLGARRSRDSREGKRTHPLLHLARDDKERASSIDEQRIDGALGIALFFSSFLSASSDPFVRNLFVCTEPLAESNPVPQDPISAIHPPCIYAGDVASAMGFALCRSKMMNGVVALHSPPMRKDAAEKNVTLFRSVGCVGSRELFTIKLGDPALLLRSNRSPLRRRFFAFSSLWTGALAPLNEFHDSLFLCASAETSFLDQGSSDSRRSYLCASAETSFLDHSPLLEVEQLPLVVRRSFVERFQRIYSKRRGTKSLDRPGRGTKSLDRPGRGTKSLDRPGRGRGALVDTGRYEVARPARERYEVARPARERYEVARPARERYEVARPAREREQATKRVVRNGTTISPLCWTAGANTVVSDQDQEPIRIWILTCRWFLTVGILPGSWWAYHELGRGGWWFRDPVENASFMPRVLATARIHSVILPLLHSWTSFLNIVTFPCCVLGTFSIRSGLLAPVHSFATDDTRGIFLWRFFLLMTGISMIIFSQMKQQASVLRTYKKEMVVARSTLVHSAHAQPRPVMLWKN